MTEILTYQVEHRTAYRYDAPVLLSYNEAHLTTRACPYQERIDQKISIQPSPLRMHEREDYFGNPCLFFSIEQTHTSLEVIVRSTLKITTRPLASLSSSVGWPATWEESRSLLQKESFRDVRQFLMDSPHIRRSSLLADYAAPSFTPGISLLQAVTHLNEKIYREFKYTPNSTTLSTSPEEVVAMRRGVCQDFAHVMIGCLRSLGFAARYVSGYIETITPADKPKLIGADASHAWVSVFFPGLGWLDFDPTNNQMPRHQHLTVAWGRDYSDVIPLRGVYLGSASQSIEVGVHVMRLG